ncbi:BCL2 modifying factor 1 [Aplochiton taeniatus]
MDDEEEDDVFVPDSRCWRTTTTSFRALKQETRGTQTAGEDLAPPARTADRARAPPAHHPGPAPALSSGMLPCGVPREPRPLFYGNAGFRLHFPARFELPGDREAAPQPWAEPGRMQAHQWEEPERPAGRSAEARVGQKLQLIGDRFHAERLQLYHRNQRNQAGPLWWRLASRMLSLLLERELGAAAWR